MTKVSILFLLILYISKIILIVITLINNLKKYENSIKNNENYVTKVTS